ncbi:hypothetical protein C1645_815407 [Glomus cerebriforme]|uniref:Uncharacterized protein n=1 Tax=Glomus cerebriforme TaxID=658196 RepID=A0A397TDR0_9GLOM|nr:hypothetical protein C1645_815407 [Glomus cerebriforme]
MEGDDPCDPSNRATVSTTTSSREQELLEEVASLRALINKSVYGRNSRRPQRIYTKNGETTGSRERFCSIKVNKWERYSPWNDQDLCKLLRLFVSKKNFKFTVFIKTPSKFKPFNEWTFPKVCELYELSDDPNPDIDVYSVFSCDSADLTSGVSLYGKNFKIVPEKLVKGHNGQGNLDLTIERRSTGRIVGLVEVKRDDFKQGFAQTTVQMESSLTCRKRKANEIDDEYDMDKVWEPVIVEYNDENMQIKVEKVLGHIVWLLDEAQKPDSSLGVEEEKVVKKHRSLSNLAGNS